MSKKNYNKISTKPEEQVIEQFDDEIIETPVEEVTETVPTEEVQPNPEYTYGKIVGCGNLRIRKKPSTNAEVLTTLAAGTTVVICPEKSTDEFYAIENGGTGCAYCMKKFIEIQ